MDIIFGYITYWTLPIIKILKLINFNVYYLHIDEDNFEKKNKLATKLRNSKVYPLPLEMEKEILPNASFSLCETDPNEIGYKRNKQLISDNILEKYCSLFSVKKVKKLRLLIQDFIFFQQMKISGKLGVWSAIYPKKKIIYISFKFKCFYNSNTGKNIHKIIIPLDFLNFFKKIFKAKNNSLEKIENFNDSDIRDLLEKKVAFIPHKGITFGNKKNMLYDKTLFYSSNINSSFHKNNILHLDYSNYLKSEKDINWIRLNKVYVPNLKFFFRTLYVALKNIYLIRSWSTFLIWLFLIHQYRFFLKYDFLVKKFKNLKLAILDYDILCPKTLVFALQNNGVKTVAAQERFIHTFYSSYATLCVDTYYTNSEYTANFIAKSKYFDVEDIIPIGFHKSKYLSLYKNENIPKEILSEKKEGKKIIVLLGFAPLQNWYESYTSLQSNWLAEISFLKDAINIAKNLSDAFLIIRYKAFKCPLRSNPYFENIVKEISKIENISISNNYDEPFYSYKLCSQANLIIAKHTSIADECLSKDIPVLFYEYTHNMIGIQTDAFNYLSSEFICYNSKELLHKSKSILFDQSNNYKNEISRLKKNIYHVENEGNMKNKIMEHLENIVN
jgi:hypothetical protein